MQWRNTEFYEVYTARGAGPRIQVAADGQRVLRDYLVEARPEKVRTAIIDFLGYSEVKEEFGVKYISRQIPHYMPGYKRYDNELFYLHASAVNVIESYTLTNGLDVVVGGVLPRFKLARLQVTYAGSRHKVLEDSEIETGPEGTPDEGRLGRFIVKAYKPFARVVTLPRQMLKWVPLAGDPATAPLTEGLALHEPGLDLTYLHYAVPAFPRGRLAAALGTVNSVEFDGFPPGTLLCEPAEATPIVQSTGSSAYDMTYRFKYLPRRARHAPDAGAERGWNYYPRYLKDVEVSPGVFEPRVDYRPVTSSGAAGGTAPYGTSDFHDLFRPDQ